MLLSRLPLVRVRSVPALALLLVAAVAAPPALAQELNCVVTVNRAQVSGPEYVFLDDLETEISRYLNARAWTDDLYDARERIDCSVQVSITEALSLSQFTAQIVVQARRPIYGTAQRSTTLLLRDADWAFSYTRGQALIYDPNRFDGLTSVLDFYALVILGIDYDTFAELGGTPFFERARQIAELGRSDGTAAGQGWGRDISEDRSRFTLVQEMLDPTFEPVRRAFFVYHFGVLDHFLAEPAPAWEAAVEFLRELNALYLQLNQRRYAMDIFFNARYQELTQLLREAPQRNEAYSLLAVMDAAHLATYDALVGSR